MNPLDPHFTFLYQLLKDNYDGYSHYIFSTTSAILLIIGWLLTSKDARAYIATHLFIKAPMLTAILLFIGAEAYFSVGAARTSDETIRLIEEVNPPIPSGYYSPSTVPHRAIVVFIAAHAVLYAILAAIIWSISNSTDEPPPSLEAADAGNSKRPL
jgi:hypothetical protein